MSSQIDADRRQLAEYLARHGTTHGDVIRADLNWTSSRFWDAIYGPAALWFTITGDGWWLTDRAKQEVTGLRSA